MNKIILLFISFALAINAYSQNKKVKFLKQEYLQFAEKLFMAKYETSYGEYINFLDSLKKNNNQELYKECYIDTSILIREFTLPYYDILKNPQTIINYPISNISYKAALEYCKWLTNNYNNNPNKKYKRVIYRLPNVNEWELAAAGGMSDVEFPWGGPFIRAKNGEFLCNFYKLVETNISYDTTTKSFIVINPKIYSIANIAESLCTINSYYPNHFGLYNMSGNVAEMVAENNIAKGGSFLDPGYDVQIKSAKKFTDKSKDVGFRVLMEVVQE